MIACALAAQQSLGGGHEGPNPLQVHLHTSFLCREQIASFYQ